MGIKRSQSVVITGAASGMGRELALQYADRGSRLALADLNAEDLNEVKTEALARGALEVICESVDVASEKQINDFSQAVIAAFPDIDIVINNAGITRMGTFAGSSQQAFEQIMNVNFWGVVFGSRAFLPALKKSRGSLTNISSLFGLIGVPGQSAYCASKFAVRGFTESLRQEVAEFDVHVACVHPGGIRTNIARNAVFDEESESRDETIDEIEKNALIMPASKAAEIIRGGISARRDRILIGRDAKTLDYIVRLFPVRYQGFLARFLPNKD
ncbi:MAG: SDR family NAD(P)-dependent oxidoreductase [Cellvibrionaceae bacterium]